MRAGGCALSLLSVPLNVEILHALEAGPTPLVELRRIVGSPPQTTMRGQLRALNEAGVVERQQQNAFPGSAEFELTAAGEDLLSLGTVLQGWLAASPEGPLELGSAASKNSIKALVQGWSSAIVRALAARPLSLTELNRLISGLNYPSLERRLGAMRLTGMIEACPGKGRSTPYSAGTWLRLAVAPMAAAVAWERRHLSSETPPLGRIDIESMFLLAIPALSLPADLSGRCRLAAELRSSSSGDPLLAGAVVAVAGGSVLSCNAKLEGAADAWATGSSRAWLDVITTSDLDGLEIGGDSQLASGLLGGLHGTLFATQQAG